MGITGQTTRRVAQDMHFAVAVYGSGFEKY
jgi:hypothetical protein